MVTVCEGWAGVTHPEPVVLRPEDGERPGCVSHGICEECIERMDKDIQSDAYDEYLKGISDPRD